MILLRKKIRHNESGFTLLEILIAIFLLAVIFATTIFYFNTNSTRANMILKIAKYYAGAAQEYRTNTGCYPNTVSALVSSSYINKFSNNTNQVTNCTPNTDSWNGPYLVNNFKINSLTDTEGSLKIPSNILPNSQINIVYIGSSSANGANQNSTDYPQLAMKINNIQDSFLGSVAKKCGGKASSKDVQYIGNCILIKNQDTTFDFYYNFYRDSDEE